MKKLYNKLVNIDKDHLLHVMCCACIAQLTGGILSLTGMALAPAAGIGLAAGVTVQFLKEIYDQFKKDSTGFDPKDMAFGIFGAAAGAALQAMPTLDVQATFGWMF